MELKDYVGKKVKYLGEDGETEETGVVKAVDEENGGLEVKPDKPAEGEEDVVFCIPPEDLTIIEDKLTRKKTPKVGKEETTTPVGGIEITSVSEEISHETVSAMEKEELKVLAKEKGVKIPLFAYKSIEALRDCVWNGLIGIIPTKPTKEKILYSKPTVAKETLKLKIEIPEEGMPPETKTPEKETITKKESLRIQSPVKKVPRLGKAEQVALAMVAGKTFDEILAETPGSEKGTMDIYRYLRPVLKTLSLI